MSHRSATSGIAALIRISATAMLARAQDDTTGL
jgi:hypothetical protein